MRQNKGIKFLAASVAIALVFVVGLPHIVHAQATKNASNAAQQAESSAEALQEQNAQKQHFFSWAVLLVAVGEFAGLIGKGISAIHSEKRAEKQRVAKPIKKVNALTYQEHKKNIYNEAFSIELPLGYEPYGIENDNFAS